MKNDFLIDKIKSIELHEVRGGKGDQLLWQAVCDSTVRAPVVGPLQESSVEFVTKPTYYECRYCGVVQKEFHSTCPQCGAPMDIDTKFVSEATPITYPAEVGQTYALGAYGLSSMASANFGRF